MDWLVVRKESCRDWDVDFHLSIQLYVYCNVILAYINIAIAYVTKKIKSAYICDAPNAPGDGIRVGRPQ